MEALRVVTVLLSGIYAGAVVLYLILLPPLFALIPAAHCVRVKRRIDPLNDRIWPPVIVVAVVCAVLLLVLDDEATTTMTVLTAVAVAAILAVAPLTRFVIIPVNKRIHALDAESASEDVQRTVEESFRALHRQWAVRHAVRMACALASFACFTIALALA